MSIDKSTEIRCGFCGKSNLEVEKLINGPITLICNECVDVCRDVLRGDEPAKPKPFVNLENFVSLATRTESNDFEAIRSRMTDKVIRLIHASQGMCTETGEFTDQLKRHVFYGAPLDEANLLEEVGDKMWYIAIALSAMDKELGEAMFKVIEKLRRRYPEKFDGNKAINRDLKSEQAVYSQDSAV